MKYKEYFDVAKKIYKDEQTGHDFSHIKRVLDFAREIAKEEGGDEFVVTVSVLFHDIHRVLSTKDKFVSAQEAMPYVKEVLKQFEMSKKDYDRIIYIIENHENKNIDIKNNKELKIVQDADILDALGKVGLRRTLKYCKTRNIPIADKNYPLSSKEYMPDIFPISTTHYVYRTMIQNTKCLKTKSGKQLAKKQIKILEDFVNKNIKKYDLVK